MASKNVDLAIEAFGAPHEHGTAASKIRDCPDPAAISSGKCRMLACEAQAGSQRQPLLSSQVIASPLPATPEREGDQAARQNSPAL